MNLYTLLKLIEDLEESYPVDSFQTIEADIGAAEAIWFSLN